MYFLAVQASDASLTVARNQAESATVLADAEGRAAPMVRNEEAEVSRGLIASFGSPLGLPRLMRYQVHTNSSR